MINPMSNAWDKTTAHMDSTNTYVTSIQLREVNDSVPESLFCLKRLQSLDIQHMNFIDGKKTY